MFNVSKKTLSVVLCLALLLSVVAVCFITPATAETITSTENFNAYKESLSSNVITLDFDGEYGVPFQRGGTAGINYTERPGFVTAGHSGAWYFFGNESAKTISTVTSQGSANAASVVENNVLYLEAGNSYIVTIDYKMVAGSTVGDKALTLRLAANPNDGPASEDMVSNLTKSGSGVVWNIDGVTQEKGSTLAADTDIQTAVFTFTVVTSGYLGMQTYSAYDCRIAIDSVKVYKPTQDTQEKITFDNGPHGVGLSRYSGAPSYSEENGNRYAVLSLTGENCSNYLANTEFTSTYTHDGAKANDYKDPDKLAGIDAAYSKLFKFKPGKSYEISFKYKYPEAQPEGCAETELRFKLMADPAGQAHAADDLKTSGTCWAKDVVISGNTLDEADVWQDCKITFTVKTLEEVKAAGYAQVRASGTPYDFDGAYFGFVGTKFVLHVDDYEVKEVDVENSKSVSVTTDIVTHDMENYTVDAKPGDFTMNSTNDASAAKVVDSGDEHGKVLNIIGNRGTFNDSNVFAAGKKYYVSFDAKTADGSSKAMWLIFANAASTTGSQTKPRYILDNGSGSHTSTFTGMDEMFKFYVNGEAVTQANFKLTGEWQRFGLVVDFTNETYNDNIAKSSSDCTALFEAARYFYFGNNNTYYDNFTIISTSDVEGAVPETDGADITTPSTIYFNDVTNVTSSNIIQNTADSTTVGTDDTDASRGNIIKISSSGSRFTFNDTNIITAGHKYTISFDAKLDAEGTSKLWMSFGAQNSQAAPRFIYNDKSGNCTQGAAMVAFKLYINGVETTYDAFAIDGTWKTYTIEFDYTNATFLEYAAADSSNAQMKGMVNQASYFHFGCANGWFDNLKIIEYTPGVDVEASIRKPSGTGEDYMSAGLRFKAAVNNDVVNSSAEIGFVVAPSTHASVTADWYKLEKGLNKIARKGVAKVGVNQDGWYYAKDTNLTYYQMVITGLSTESGNTAYNRRFSVVLYTKDAEGNYSYYALGEASYYQALGITEALKAQ